MARKSGAQGRRKTTHKYVTARAQGPQSWIEFKIPTWAESREAINSMRDDARSLIQRDSGSLALLPKEDQELGDVENQLVDMIWGLATAKFHDWNWCGEDGEPLPPMNEMEPGDLLQPELGLILEITQDLYGLRDLDEAGKARS